MTRLPHHEINKARTDMGLPPEDGQSAEDLEAQIGFLILGPEGYVQRDTYEEAGDAAREIADRCGWAYLFRPSSVFTKEIEHEQDNTPSVPDVGTGEQPDEG